LHDEPPRIVLLRVSLNNLFDSEKHAYRCLPADQNIIGTLEERTKRE
jgi:hypothetical protein